MQGSASQAVIYALLLVVIYFIPTATGIKKRNAKAIFALNLFLGWTLIGWVAALVWALTKDAPPTVVVHPVTRPPEVRL